jgi:hypothetical protein
VGGASAGGVDQDPALAAYEWLRCERRRGRLLEIVAVPGDDNTNTEEDELPGLGHDVGSDELDKHDSTPLLDFRSMMVAHAGVCVIGEGGVENPNGDGGIVVGDASAHLLRMVSSTTP